jgi:beta-glucanase (GH16 family)
VRLPSLRNKESTMTSNYGCKLPRPGFLFAGFALGVTLLSGSAVHAQAVLPTLLNESTRGYVLTFSDEFDNGFNTGKWNEAIWYEQSHPIKNFKVENGLLKIWPAPDALGEFHNRTIDTDSKFSQTYGFFEMEAKLPYGRGPWPAFWLFNHIGTKRPEIDIMEGYPGGGPASYWSTADYHSNAYGTTVWRDATTQTGWVMIPSGPIDLSTSFNKYGVRWDPSKITFYFNGRQVYSVNARMRDPMYIILSLWFGSASGPAGSYTPSGESNSFEISYVRAWRLP